MDQYTRNVNELNSFRSGNCKMTDRVLWHTHRHEIIQVTISWVFQLERSEANIVESFIVDAERRIRIFNELVDR